MWTENIRPWYCCTWFLEAKMWANVRWGNPHHERMSCTTFPLTAHISFSSGSNSCEMCKMPSERPSKSFQQNPQVLTRWGYCTPAMALAMSTRIGVWRDCSKGHLRYRSIVLAEQSSIYYSDIPKISKILRSTSDDKPSFQLRPAHIKLRAYLIGVVLSVQKRQQCWRKRRSSMRLQLSNWCRRRAGESWPCHPQRRSTSAGMLAIHPVRSCTHIRSHFEIGVLGRRGNKGRKWRRHASVS